MSERRRFRRIPVHQRCWCEGDDLTLYAQMGNLSEGGAFVRTYSPLPHGSRAKVRFTAGEGLAVEAQATVVWRSDGSRPGVVPGMGLSFDGLSEPVLEALRSFIESSGAEIEEESG